MQKKDLWSMEMNLIEIARKTIEARLTNRNFEIPELDKKRLSKKQACFVTLTIDGNLRGCMGSLIPHQELWKDIQENAINAAFYDPRFPPLTLEEFYKTKIEISLLSIPGKLKFSNIEELLSKLDSRPGLILKKGNVLSTFLPQVWEDIPDKIEFLEQLSLKAGLPKDAWKSAEFEYYTVEKIKE